MKWILIPVAKNKGFTLIELMIVVAIMAILAAIAIPNYFKFRCASRGRDLGINSEIAHEICSSCPGCELQNITPEKAFEEMARGAPPEVFLGNKANVETVRINSKSCKAQDERILELEQQIELEQQKAKLLQKKAKWLEKELYGESASEEEERLKQEEARIKEELEPKVESELKQKQIRINEGMKESQ